MANNMDASEHAELAGLRMRAYGRGGDIHDDPDARRRLEVLEALARGAAAEVASSELSVVAQSGPSMESASQQPHAAVASERQAAHDVHDAAEDPNAVDTVNVAGSVPVSRRARRNEWLRRPAVWLASIALTAIVSAVTTAAVMSYDGSIVGRLAPAGAAQESETQGISFIDSAVRYDDFNGLTVVVGTPSADAGYVCIAVFAPPSGRFVAGDCSYEGIAPRLDVVVGVDPEDGLGEAFEKGTRVQFSLEGDVVVVRADGPLPVRASID